MTRSGAVPAALSRASRAASASLRPEPAAPTTSIAPGPVLDHPSLGVREPHPEAGGVSLHRPNASGPGEHHPTGRRGPSQARHPLAWPRWRASSPPNGAAPRRARTRGEIDWLSACRRMVAAQRELFAEQRGIAARTVYVGIGEGGDRTLAIDRQCEDIVFAELERLHAEGHRVQGDLRGARGGRLRRLGVVRSA